MPSDGAAEGIASVGEPVVGASLKANEAGMEQNPAGPGEPREWNGFLQRPLVGRDHDAEICILSVRLTRSSCPWREVELPVAVVPLEGAPRLASELSVQYANGSYRGPGDFLDTTGKVTRVADEQPLVDPISSGCVPLRVDDWDLGLETKHISLRQRELRPIGTRQVEALRESRVPSDLMDLPLERFVVAA